MDNDRNQYQPENEGQKKGKFLKNLALIGISFILAVITIIVINL